MVSLSGILYSDIERWKLEMIVKIREKDKVNRLILSGTLSSFLALYACIMIISCVGTSVSFASFDLPVFVLVITVFLISFAIIFFVWPLLRPTFRFVFRYRFAIALFALFLLVLFSISGSSISELASLLGTTENDGRLFGLARSIRSDEFVVNTLVQLSQEFNEYEKLSSIIRGDITDTVFIYGGVSWSLATLFRPALWGYLILGSSRGLSFFWCSRFIALFLVSFEFARIFTKDNRYLSASYAVLVTFAPFVVWWNSTDVLAYGQALVLSLYYFLHSSNTWLRFFCLAMIAWLAGCYLMLSYPAWQVPMFYVFALAGAWVIVEYRKSHLGLFKLKRDLPVLFFFLGLSGFAILTIFRGSADAIVAASETVYPGSRFVTGGGYGKCLFYGYISIFGAASSDIAPVNVCESATFFSLFPIGIIVAVMVIIKKRDLLLVITLLLQIFFLLFGLVGFPSFLAKITLMSNVSVLRLLLPVGFLDTLLLVRSLALISEGGNTCLFVLSEKSKKLLAIVSFAISILLVALVWLTVPSHRDYLIAACLLCAIFSYLWAMGKAVFQKASYFSLLIIAIITVAVPGMLVNPIQQGLSVIEDSPLLQLVSETNDEDAGLWICDSWIVANVCMSRGVSTVNSTNAYPNMDRWSQIDPEGEYEEVYNRYAHISVELTNEPESSFVLMQADLFKINLSLHDIEKLGIKYFATAGSIDGKLLHDAQECGIEIEYIDTQVGYSVYKFLY